MTQTARRAKFRDSAVDVVIDVRSKIEFWFGHLPGAICIPVDAILEEVERRDDIGPSSRILLYCASGARSATAAQMLRRAGYRNVVDGGGHSAAARHFTPAED